MVPDCLEGKVANEDIVAKLRQCQSQQMDFSLDVQISNLIHDNCPSCLIEANKVVANVVEAAAANIKYEAQEDSTQVDTYQMSLSMHPT